MRQNYIEFTVIIIAALTLCSTNTYPSIATDVAPVAGTPVAGAVTTVADTPAAFTAAPTASAVIVDGRSITFDAYNIAGYNYFKLRDLALQLNGTPKQFAVGWDETLDT